MTATMATLPDHLRVYCAEQDYGKYTWRDHAAWRYIMKRAVSFFSQHAVSVYAQGLEATGITLDKIPDITKMDEQLQKIGWGAAPVCGFIAPWAFLEFQARKILPIATDMRSVDHIGYTPAPDIVHEAAGHAPILLDEDYSEYLSHYARIGTRAIFSKQDADLYEAIRYLSDIKEKPESSAAEIKLAEKNLEAAKKQLTGVSEAAEVGRMSWWTAEYGLVGTVEDPKIYGAGLLSSVEEGKNALGPTVEKIPFSLDCIQQGFDITKPQPQLYVARDMTHLIDVLHELESHLACSHGGVRALEKAKECEYVTTSVFSSGIAVSGIVSHYETRDSKVIFVRYQSAIQFSYHHKQLENFGHARFPDVYHLPLGRLENHPEISLATVTLAQLKDINISKGSKTLLRYKGGYRVSGTVKDIVCYERRPLVVTLTDCTIRKDDNIIHSPVDGEYHLILAEEITAVWGGPGDRANYIELDHVEPETTPGRGSPYSKKELKLFELYGDLRRMRDAYRDHGSVEPEKLEKIYQHLLKNAKKEWLLFLEVYEQGLQYQSTHAKLSWIKDLQDHLASAKLSEGQRLLLQEGLELV